ncbi:hypothetical protein NO976_01166 [Planktothrix agardhii]|jgi:hypothetical protein|uniref:hypothetical protein n=1 Tax=Planktothrix agardhii TaxID=1160 RepID=UPI0020A733CB|nr:hypothetical protein [Planktothrix agardhii]CAD5928410.1 hypothetical protein NO976_01166 [Planktothrix agardhii]
MKINLSKTLVTSAVIATGIAFISLNYSPPLFAQSNSNSPQLTPKMLHDSLQRMRREQSINQIWQNYRMMRQDLEINALLRQRQYSGLIYDPSRVKTFQGTVTEIQPGNQENPTSQDVHLLMKTNKETLEVHVAPLWYLEEHDFQIQLNDSLEVTGMRVKRRRQSILIVGEIKKGNQTLQLRDEDGYPRWTRLLQQTPVN